MKVDIRNYTSLIVGRGNEFLVGCIMGSTEIRWSICAWDAWRTRIWEDARKVAQKVGGEIMMFNPVTGELRKADHI